MKQMGEVGEPKNGNNGQTSTSLDLAGILRLVLPMLGIFGALAYVMGRLYIQSYYSEFGLSGSALTFTIEDYMFFSFDVVIMSLVVAYFFSQYWYGTRSGESVSGEAWVFGIPFKKPYSTTNILTGLTILVGIVLLMYSFVTNQFIHAGPGLTGLVVGTVLGILLNAYDWTSTRIFSWRTQDERFSRFARTLDVFFVALLLFAYLPSITGKMAAGRAHYDLARLPQVVITSQEDLPVALSSGSDNPKESVKVGLVTINDGMAYLLAYIDDTSGETGTEQEVHAIPVSTIKQITYFKTPK